jgi:hypothetical protein
MLNKLLNEDKKRRNIDTRNAWPTRDVYPGPQNEDLHEQSIFAGCTPGVQSVLKIGQRNATEWSANKLAVATGLSRKTSGQILRLVNMPETIEFQL